LLADQLVAIGLAYHAKRAYSRIYYTISAKSKALGLSSAVDRRKHDRHAVKQKLATDFDFLGAEMKYVSHLVSIELEYLLLSPLKIRSSNSNMGG
jgi:uncharacterized protein (UPF0332 family)